MVRLVFRPFTQVRRSICTLESRRTSTRVSPGFALLRQSSPSFGSRHVCSHSNLSPEGSWSVDSAISFLSYGVHVNYALGGQPRALAHMSDSLVRVSRRGVEKHFARIGITSVQVTTGIHLARGSAALSRNPNPSWHTRGTATPPKGDARRPRAHTASLRFLFSKFRYF